MSAPGMRWPATPWRSEAAGVMNEHDVIVIGGGVVGTAIAYGLAGLGDRVRVLDEGDDAFRAARGNFGLVWVSGKGLANIDYARWSRAAAAAWPAFGGELEALTGIDLQRSRNGGLTLCVEETELSRRVRDLESIRSAIGGDYPYEVLDPKALREIEPAVGPEVAGAIFSPLDGHVSPLRLLRSLVQGFQRRGGELVTHARCHRIQQRRGVFHVRAGDNEHVAPRVVLAAGLGNRELAPLVGLEAPIRPNRGQILITERMQPFLRRPSQLVRQTGEGTVQIGDSQEDVGMDDGTSTDQLARIAARACRLFPVLASVNVVRAWGALRVLTSDGFPLYQASAACPGAFLVTCHSGVTLASMHAGALAEWIHGGPEPGQIRTFKAQRFHV